MKGLPEYNGVITDGDQVYLVGGAYGNFRVTTNDKKELVVGEGLRFQRVRRVTGYLTGTLDRFNNAKRAEVSDRVKHLSVGGI